MWLGKKRGYLQDWITQRWVKTTGKKIDPDKCQWLLGPIGSTDKIEDSFIKNLCLNEQLSIQKNGKDFGLMDSIDEWGLSEEQRKKLNHQVADFYEHTINYDFEVWSSWSGFFYPFGRL